KNPDRTRSELDGRRAPRRRVSSKFLGGTLGLSDPGLLGSSATTPRPSAASSPVSCLYLLVLDSASWAGGAGRFGCRREPCVPWISVTYWLFAQTSSSEASSHRYPKLLWNDK